MTAVVEINTAQLIGPALDWAVAQCEKRPVSIQGNGVFYRVSALTPDMDGSYIETIVPYDPSTNPLLAFEIITREGIATRQYRKSDFEILEPRHFDASRGDVIRAHFGRDMVFRPIDQGGDECFWYARRSDANRITHWRKDDYRSPTLLVAAMRFYVSTIYGRSVAIPESLLGRAA